MADESDVFEGLGLDWLEADLHACRIMKSQHNNLCKKYCNNNSVCLCKEILNLASFETTKPLFLKYCLDDFASNIGCASYLLE